MRPSMRMPSSAANRVSDASSPESCDLGLILLSMSSLPSRVFTLQASIPKGRLPIYYYCRCAARGRKAGDVCEVREVGSILLAPFTCSLQTPSWRRSSTIAVLARQKAVICRWPGDQSTEAVQLIGIHALQSAALIHNQRPRHSNDTTMCLSVCLSSVLSCCVARRNSICVARRDFIYACRRTCMAYRLRPGDSMNAPTTTAAALQAVSMPWGDDNHWSQDAVAEVSAGTHMNRGTAPACAATAYMCY